MFYRRKIILAILQSFEGYLQKISLQKLLFLFVNRQNKSDYFFVPYHYGCYSFSANADLKTMIRQNYLSENMDYISKIDSFDYINTLKESDKKILIDIKKLYGNLNTDLLIKFTYLNYHYYAINSIMAKDILNDKQYEKITFAKPINDKIILFTIGYEGISLEEYLNRLIKNDVKVLIDVRNNASSMKFGFSKSQLKTFCNNLNIEYLHVPEVGINSNQRRDLKTQEDYDNLFEIYKKDTLRSTLNHQKSILTLLKKKKRIALTCFEKEICQCHRKHLAEAIIKLPEWNFELKHI